MPKILRTWEEELLIGEDTPSKIDLFFRFIVLNILLFVVSFVILLIISELFFEFILKFKSYIVVLPPTIISILFTLSQSSKTELNRMIILNRKTSKLSVIITGFGGKLVSYSIFRSSEIEYVIKYKDNKRGYYPTFVTSVGLKTLYAVYDTKVDESVKCDDMVIIKNQPLNVHQILCLTSKFLNVTYKF